MKHVRFWLTVLALAAIELRAETQLVIPTEPGSNIAIKLSSPAIAVPHFGFLPVRVQIENLTSRDGVWRFRFEAGSRSVFPGLAGSTFEVAVPSPQTRELWLFVPLAEPGLTLGPPSAPLIALGGGGGGGSLTLSGASPAIPPIAGVYPNSPAGVAPPQVTTTSSGTVIIRQTGPAALLPPLGAAQLPARASSSISASSTAGEVVRMTIIQPAAGTTIGTPSVVPSRAGSPTQAAVTNARNKLATVGLDLSTTASSASIPSGGTDVTVILRQTGPAANLPLPPLASLPAGFTAVAVNPGANAGEVVREFTYVEKISPAAAAAARGGGNAVSPAAGRAAAEAEARKILAGTNLLSPPAGVTSRPAQPMMASNRAAVAGPSSLIYPMVLFEQVGPASALPFAPPASLPPEVRVSLHPAPVSGQVTRVITVLNPVDYAALRSSAAAAVAPAAMSEQMNLFRLELQRLGYLRSIAGVQSGSSIRSASGAGAPTTMIFTESGPANLLPSVPAGDLPVGITSNITPSPIAGEVSRNFIVDIATAMAGIGPTGATPASSSPVAAAVAAARTARAGPTPPASGPLPPTPLTVEVTGPGVATARTAFPNSGSSPLPPVAVAAGIEAALRAKLVAAGLRVVPNFAPVDPAQLPADWRVWSAFNSVVLKSEDYAALDAARRAALRSWVGMGGVLFLVPSAPVEAGAGEPRTERLGAGRIERIPTPLADLLSSEMLITFELEQLAPGMPDRNRLRLAPGTPLGELARFEPDDVLWLTLFLILFAILIGPVNLFLFAPPTKRHRLFFTTPLISLGGAIAVAVAIVLQDGFGGEGARRAFVVLLPGQNQAAVFQEQATHTGFLTSRQFGLDDAVLCAALPTDDLPFGNLSVPLQVERERGSAVGDWFRNRSRQALLLRQLVPTRARIELVSTAAGGVPVIESTLATELKQFRLRDDRGNFWTAPAVAPGRRVTLTAEPAPAAASSAPAPTSATNGTESFSALMTSTVLRGAWQWSAQGGATEVAPIRTLPSIRWRDDEIAYAGVAERAGASRPSVPAAPAEKGAQ